MRDTNGKTEKLLVGITNSFTKRKVTNFIRDFPINFNGLQT